MRYKKGNHKGKIYHGNVKTLTVENQIYDIFALRIIVNDVATCYRILRPIT